MYVVQFLYINHIVKIISFSDYIHIQKLIKITNINTKYLTVSQKLFQVTQEDMIETENEYKAQTPVLWNAGMNMDLSFLQIATIGRKHNFDYLLHLVDDFSLHRVKRLRNDEKEDEADLEPGTWADPQIHGHFGKLKDVEVKVVRQPTDDDPNQNKYQMIDYKQLAKHAVSSFSNRCCGKLMFNTMSKINDSVEIVINYLFVSNGFCAKLVNEEYGTCPFLMEVIIHTGEPVFVDKDVGLITNEEEDEDDDDDDDDDAKEHDKDIAKKYTDYVGNVEEKLKANKLPYMKYKRDANDKAEFSVRALGTLFREFIDKYKLKGAEDAFEYPHRQRFILFIDRRGCKGVPNDASDEIYLYCPPQGPYTREIPMNAVPEWGFGAARTCWLPNIGYEQEDATGSTKWESNGKKNNQQKKPKKKKNNKTAEGNISSAHHSKGGLITFSFHVRQMDIVKLYLYWNSGVMRLLPQDLGKVFSRIFSKSQENIKYFKNNKRLDGMIEKMKKTLIDRPFDGFLNSYNHQS